MSAPTPRLEIYDTYWHFAYRRQEAFMSRLKGQAAPWSDDPILQQYKFCNVFRATDRESQYLIKDIIYTPQKATPQDLLFQIIAFRFFSKSQTWESLTQALGRPIEINDLRNTVTLDKTLKAIRAQNGTLYTSAFILCANNAFHCATKHENHLALWKKMFIDDRLAEKLLESPSLKAVYELLLAYPLIGPFMAYQLAIDLNYSPLINFSENDFTQPGPGALRGIKKAFIATGATSTSDIIRHMVDTQAENFKRLSLPFKGLWGRPLHAIDAQGLFCELDKYCRVAAPHLASNRTRIKAKFKPNSTPIPLFLPPKWKLTIS